MPVVTIHDLPQIDSTTLSDEAELMVNNSNQEMVQANKITKAEFLKSVTAALANLDGDIVELQTDLQDDAYLKAITGYDATKTQVLKNINGTLTWVEEAA